jgi:hypothetical protein
MICQPVLWVDPGKMTGLALYVPYQMQFIREADFIQASATIESACRHYGHPLLVGWESFRIGPRTPPADAHYAIEMIGVTRYLAMKFNCQILQPASPDQRLTASRSMLQALGWWTAGRDDAQSAAQHMLSWMLRTDNLPAKEAGILADARYR